MSHQIDAKMPGPRHGLYDGEPLNVYVHAVGPRDVSARGQHGFGVVVTGLHGLQLCEFGYKSTSEDTTGNRGQLGSLLSAIIWREQFGVAALLTVKTRHQYLYLDFAQRAERWITTGKKADGKEPLNFELIKRMFERWRANDEPAAIVRVPPEETRHTDRAEEIAKAMRDHGTIERVVKPGSEDDFCVVDEDIDELIERALYKEARREERLAMGS